jgi:hypothetical protein
MTITLDGRGSIVYENLRGLPAARRLFLKGQEFSLFPLFSPFL